jgi:hypothetical protein
MLFRAALKVLGRRFGLGAGDLDQGGERPGSATDQRSSLIPEIDWPNPHPIRLFSSDEELVKCARKFSNNQIGRRRP